MIEIKTTPARLKLVAANARAVIAQVNATQYRVATGGQHAPAGWFVESNRDPGFSATSQYHDTRAGAEIELAGLNCKTQGEYAAHLLRQLTA